MLPNFLIIGAEKAGTTSLAGLLASHPDIFISHPKEPQFFSCQNWGRGFDWYESLFEAVAGEKAVGEASPAYTVSPRDPNPPERIVKHMGKDIRLIYLVRDPVNRMISHYKHCLYHRRIPDGTALEKAVELLPYIYDASRYFYQISQYLEAGFSKKNMCVLALEELIREPVFFQQMLYRHLGVDETCSATLPRENAFEGKVRYRRKSPQWEMVKQLIPEKFYLKLRKSMGRLVTSNVVVGDISEEYKNTLRQSFSDDVASLSKLFDYDYSSLWAMHGKS